MKMDILGGVPEAELGEFYDTLQVILYNPCPNPILCENCIFRLNKEDEQSPAHLPHSLQTLSNPERLYYSPSNTLTLSFSFL